MKEENPMVNSPAFNKTASQTQIQTPVMKKFSKAQNTKNNMMLVVGSLLVVLSGIATGWFMSGGVKGSDNMATTGVAPGAEKSATEAGIEDENTFPDEAEGVLTEGGIEGEGTHYLDRNAGATKNVYLTSTVIDLQSFVGKKVHVWGETIAAQNAPWLMDVGKLKVVE